MTIYKSSSGDKVIAEMPLSYAKNALNKLLRTEPERKEEIDALQAHVDAKTTEAEAAALNPAPRDAVIGDNGGPALEAAAPKPSGRAAIETHVNDLLDQVKGCPLAIADETQANDVARLHRDLQAAVKLVDNAADKEKEPHNKAVAEIGAWQNGFTAAKLKRTPDGSLTKALLATSNLSSAWLRKVEDDRRAREAAAAEVARAAAQEAIAAREEAKTSTDVEVIDRADNALAEAQALIKQAVGVTKERPQAGGGEGYKALGLRSVYTAHIIDEPGAWGLAYGHYKKSPEFMAEFHALIQKWADRDARVEATRVLGVPGFTFLETKVAA